MHRHKEGNASVDADSLPSLEKEQDTLKERGYHLGKDLVSYIPAKLVPALTGFVGIAVYTRLLSPEDYGIYVLAMATVSLVSFLGFDWLDLALIRYFERSRSEGRLTSFFTTHLVVRSVLILLISSIWLLVTYLLRNQFSAQALHLLRIGILIFSVGGMTSLGLSLLRAEQQSVRYSIYTSAQATFRLLVAVLLLYLVSRSPSSLLWGSCIAGGIIVGWLYMELMSRYSFDAKLFSTETAWKHTRYGFSLIGVTACYLILSISDRYMIGYFLGTEAVGIYSAGYSVPEVGLKSFSNLLMLPIYPLIVSIFEQRGEREAQKALSRFIGIYLTLSIPVCFGISMLARDIADVLFGTSFRSAYILFPWVVGGVFCLGLVGYFNKAFEIKEQTKFLSYSILVAAVLNIVLNVFFIPWFGFVGAAYSTLAAYLFYLALSLLFGRRLFPIRFPWNTAVKTLGSSLAMVAVLYLGLSSFPRSLAFLVLKISVGAVVYFVLGLMLRQDLIISLCQWMKSTRIPHRKGK